MRKMRWHQEEKRKRERLEKNKKERFKQRARSLLGNLSPVKVATQVFDSIQRNNSFTAVGRINIDYRKKLVKQLHLDPFLWLLEESVFSTTSTKSLEQVAAILNAQNHGSARCSAKGADAERDVEAIESDNEVDGADEAGVGDAEIVELWTVLVSTYWNMKLIWKNSIFSS